MKTFRIPPFHLFLSNSLPLGEQGWAYEGFFDTDRRHRHGVINWPDGSCYLGDWYYDKMQGKGIYITALRDVYRGEVRDGYFHGHGEM